MKKQPRVTAPPPAFFERYRESERESARTFYKKYVDLGGLSIAAASEVEDAALLRTHFLVSHLLAGRPDVLETMAKFGTRLIVIGKDQVYTDMPEYRRSPNPAYLNERVRGTGGFDVTSFGEENLLNLPLDRYDDESIAVHEFCHTIDAALGRLDPSWRQRLSGVYRAALAKDLWKNTYAASNPGEYWGEICQSYFDCNRINNWNHGPIGTREQLKAYDPEGYALVETTFKLTKDIDWRYTPLRKQPRVIAPPAKFAFPVVYTKFTLARELPVLATKNVSDAAMLKANDTVRKVFAYRHDLLKAFIAASGRLVLEGKGDAKRPPLSTEVVVPADQPAKVVAALFKAVYLVTATRPVDPEFEQRRDKQQYELRVKRLDITFDQRVKALLKGNQDTATYFSNGVAAYFDAEGKRDALKAQDPELFALVEETMAYTSHPDWRFAR